MKKIAISSGDPAGIGPDICLMSHGKNKGYRPVIFGDIEVLKERSKMLGLNIDLQKYSGEDVINLTDQCLWVSHKELGCEFEIGKLNPKASHYTISLFKQAVELTSSGDFDALVTCPINKEAINLAGIRFKGHTEEIAKLTDTKRVVMMLSNSRINVALATTHCPLSEVPKLLTKQLIKDSIHIIYNDMTQKWGFKSPQIKVLGLNPHAGEGGFIGKEEEEIIKPAINEIRDEGIRVIGPSSADTAFIQNKNEKIDAYFAMFHDQGLPVIKSIDFGHIVNVTLGLPITRTSVDHGTAYDIAGKGYANEGSLLAACKLAEKIS
tara:strand:+ start:6074 stop:7039 length:966 start_codon:yes stop_codon:yes gene_type:complete